MQVNVINPRTGLPCYRLHSPVWEKLLGETDTFFACINIPRIDVVVPTSGKSWPFTHLHIHVSAAWVANDMHVLSLAAADAHTRWQFGAFIPGEMDKTFDLENFPTFFGVIELAVLAHIQRQLSDQPLNESASVSTMTRH
ncbi:MAG TPA: hypothetical protein GXX48_11270 [Ochrobactrum intermedium]|uniref:Uncharacterized protein n=1 Tax=Brucella intermedia TaxID=94625 RepID=A0A7V6PC48_9HYPH|nr:hypothetical protein [Brucella intermedia]HHV68208.1 hypothetical protein [Brucella intermedia]